MGIAQGKGTILEKAASAVRALAPISSSNDGQSTGSSRTPGIPGLTPKSRWRRWPPSIVTFGWTNPILAGPDGVVICRPRPVAGRPQLGMTEVPVIVLRGFDRVGTPAFVLADNKLALNAGWDEECCGVKLESLKEDDFNLDVVGFSAEELKYPGGPERRAKTDRGAVSGRAGGKVITVPARVVCWGQHRLPLRRRHRYSRSGEG